MAAAAKGGIAPSVRGISPSDEDSPGAQNYPRIHCAQGESLSHAAAVRDALAAGGESAVDPVSLTSAFAVDVPNEGGWPPKGRRPRNWDTACVRVFPSNSTDHNI